MNIILSILSAVGMAIIITRSSILEQFRNYVTTKSKLIGELINCLLCTSFWTGLLFSLIEYNFYILFSTTFIAYIIMLYEDK